MRQARGFTILEVLVLLAIVGVLAAFVTPKFAHDNRRAIYSEIKQAAAPIQRAVERCVSSNKGPESCNRPLFAGKAVITPKMLRKAADSTPRVAEIRLSSQSGKPVITVVPAGGDGLTVDDYYVVTARMSHTLDAVKRWAESGGGCEQDYC